MNSEFDDNLEFVWGEEFAENMPEYKASQDIKRLLEYKPEVGKEINYMSTVSDIYEHYLIMKEQYDNFEDSRYEAEFISGLVDKFFIENTAEV